MQKPQNLTTFCNCFERIYTCQSPHHYILSYSTPSTHHIYKNPWFRVIRITSSSNTTKPQTLKRDTTNQSIGVPMWKQWIQTTRSQMRTHGLQKSTRVLFDGHKVLLFKDELRRHEGIHEKVMEILHEKCEVLACFQRELQRRSVSL